jgi:hypothetical protein
MSPEQLEQMDQVRGAFYSRSEPLSKSEGTVVAIMTHECFCLWVFMGGQDATLSFEHLNHKDNK